MPNLDLDLSREKHTQAAKLMAQGKYAAALGVLEEIIPVFEQASEWEEYAKAFNYRNECLWRRGKIAEAETNALYALDIIKDKLGEGHNASANCYNLLANCQMERGNCDKAIDYHQQALAVWVNLWGEGHRHIAITLNNLALCYNLKGDYYTAIAYHQKALEIRQKHYGEKHQETSIVYYSIGNCHTYITDYELAILYIRKSINIIEENYSRNHYLLITFYSSMASCYMQKKQLDIGATYYDHAMSICELNEDNAYSMGIITHNLGCLHTDRNELDKAIFYHNKAHDNWTEFHGEKHENIAHNRLNLGGCYCKKGQYDKGIEYMHEGVSMLAQIFGQQSQRVGRAQCVLADAYWQKKDITNALNYSQQALQNLLPDVVITADPYALPLGEMPLNYAEYLLDLFGLKSKIFFYLYQQTQTPKDLTAALAHYQCSDALIERMRQIYKTESSKLTLAEKVKNIVYDEAIRAAFAYHQLQQTTTNTQPLSAFNQSLGYNLPDNPLDLAFYFSEKSKAILLLASMKDAELQQQLPAELRQQEYHLRVELDYLERSISEENYKSEETRNDAIIQEWQNRLFDFKQQYDLLIERLEREFPDYYRLKYDTKVADIAQLQASLPPNAALISYCVAENNLYVFCISGQDYKAISLPIGESNINTLTDELLQKINNNLPTVNARHTFAEASHVLYEAIFAPIVPHLPHNCDELIIIPSGNLSRIPFGVLLQDMPMRGEHYADMNYLETKYTLSYHYSATLWHYGACRSGEALQPENAQPTAAQGSYVGFAPVVFSQKPTVENSQEKAAPKAAIKAETVTMRGQSYTALPHTEAEINEVGDLLSQHQYEAITFTRQKATLQQLKQILQQQPNVKFLHLAAHGTYNAKHPELSGIVLSPDEDMNHTPKENTNELSELEAELLASKERDPAEQHGAMLYVGETYQLNLRGVELVVLSCCDTGLGKLATGEGMLAINRGFLYAGAKNVLFTLFKVPDEHSKLLVTTFFAQLFIVKNHAKALQLAKQTLIRTQGVCPIDWAGFVLMGNNKGF